MSSDMVKKLPMLHSLLRSTTVLKFKDNLEVKERIVKEDITKSDILCKDKEKVG